MTAAITLAGWFLIFGGWFALSFLAAVLIGRIIRGPSERERRAEQLEVDGPLTSLAAERQRRVARAQFRHVTRHHKDVA